MKYLRYIIVVLLLICPIILDAQRNIPLCIEQINSLPANSDKDTYEMLLKEFAKSGGNIKDIGNGILKSRVHEALRRNKNVLQYATYYNNNGCTIVRLKI